MALETFTGAMFFSGKSQRPHEKCSGPVFSQCEMFMSYVDGCFLCL